MLFIQGIYILHYHQGFFKPTNPQKYKGDPDKIVYRSGLEKKFFKLMDTESNILWWSSEEMFIPYRSPIDDPNENKIRRYFVDIVFGTTNEETIMAEIKPSTQVSRPKPRKNSKNYIKESITYSVNDAKWKAAMAYCEKNNMRFVILTEKNLPKALR
jgi:hypothetical protein